MTGARIPRPCPVCGTVFEPKRGNRPKACSEACARELIARAKRGRRNPNYRTPAQKRAARAAKRAQGKPCARPGCSRRVLAGVAYCSPACHYVDRERVGRPGWRGGDKLRREWIAGDLKCARCGAAGLRHHVVLERHVIELGGERWDVRNRLGLCRRHHDAHHARADTVPVSLLPDAALAFAAELMGGPRAALYFRRYYAGDDPRLERLEASPGDGPDAGRHPAAWEVSGEPA